MGRIRRKGIMEKLDESIELALMLIQHHLKQSTKLLISIQKLINKKEKENG